MLQQSLAVFLVLGLLLAALWFLRQKGRAGAGFLVRSNALAGSKWSDRLFGSKRLRPVERLVLSPQHALHVILIENRPVLFATSPGGCQLLDYNLSETTQRTFEEGAAC